MGFLLMRRDVGKRRRNARRCAGDQCYDERMNWIRGSVAILLLGIWAGASAIAQNPPAAARSPYDGSDSLSGPKPIHVDENCRILPGSEGTPHAKKARPYSDSAVCSLEGIAQSTHWEEKIAGSQLQRWFVRVKERTFVLQDIADEPVVFIVRYAIPQDWFVDSNPQPWQTVDRTAYFRAYVKPGETVRLHVGVRREWPAKSKPI
jgi:hypothetical protein